MLPMFALLIFVLLGIGALSVDLGLALWTQQTMQDAADPASLAGGREMRGGTPEESAKTAARDWVSYSFDDDTKLPADAWSRGAGPAIELSPGSGGELQANQGMTVLHGATGKPLVYKPGLRLNAVNAPHGDLVVGKYTGGWPVSETAAYARNDFMVAPYSEQARTLLVRLRRTNNFVIPSGPQAGQRLDDVPDVSSTGAPLPFLFGRGALIEKSPSATYSPREHGLTVRATAIAQGRPVLSVGLPHTPAGIRGVLPIAFDQVYWSGLGGNFEDVDVPDVGAVPPIPALEMNTSGVIGNPGPVGLTVPPLKTVGTEVTILPLDPSYVNVLLEGYFPLYDLVASETGPSPPTRMLVVGYGYGTVRVKDNGLVEIVRMGAGLHGRNASSVPIRPPQLNGVEWANIFQLNAQIVATGLAPALVR